MTDVEELTADLRSLSTSRVATPLASDTERIMSSSEAQAAPVESAPSQQTEEEEQKRKTAAEKWYNPNGPPVGSHMGARLLEGDKDVWDHNAWDHVELPEDFHEKAKEKISAQMAKPVKEELRDSYNADPASFWNNFYSRNKDAFFKDRAWLRLEFPELIACTEADAGPKTILEVGCGAGNTVFPLLNHNENPDLQLWATDYSAQAVEVVKSNEMYPRASHGKGILHAGVWDISAKPSPSASSSASPPAPSTTPFILPEGLQPGSVDILTAIFVLSALHPLEWQQAMTNIYAALKPGGLLCVRDYGRHDLAQLRMKKERLLDPEWPNLYIRGDGTRVWFFSQRDLRAMMQSSAEGLGRYVGALKGRQDIAEAEASGDEQTSKDEALRDGRFEISQLSEDRRLLVNRKERLQMYRIWMQVKANKRSHSRS